MRKNKYTLIISIVLLIATLSSAVVFAVAFNEENTHAENTILSTSERNTEIAVVPAEIMLDVPSDEPSTMDLAGDVLIIHTHTQEEGEYLLKAFEIPQYIYDEMNALNWDKKQQRECLITMNANKIDMTKAWELMLDGTTQDEIITLKNQNDEYKTQLINQYINDEITIEAYIDEYPFDLEDISAEQIREKAVDLQETMHNRLIQNSGLNEMEMSYCARNGITSIKEMAQAKYMSSNLQIDFNNVVQTKATSADWIETEAKLTNKTYEEIQTKNTQITNKEVTTE